MSFVSQIPMLNTNTTQVVTWVTICGIILAAIQLLVRWVEYKLNHEKADETFRRDLLNRVHQLEMENRDQVKEMASQAKKMDILITRIDELETDLNHERKLRKSERALKQYFRDRLTKCLFSLELYRKLHPRIEGDYFEWTAQDNAIMNTPLGSLLNSSFVVDGDLVLYDTHTFASHSGSKQDQKEDRS